jgi:hypothetical protein
MIKNIFRANHTICLSSLNEMPLFFFTESFLLQKALYILAIKNRKDIQRVVNHLLKLRKTKAFYLL